MELRKWVDKSWKIAGLIFAFQVALVVPLAIILDYFGVNTSFLSILAVFFGALMISYAYSKIFKVQMPKELKFKTAGIHTCINFIYSVFYITAYAGAGNWDWFVVLIILAGAVVNFGVVYWGFGRGWKIYIKETEKKK